MGFNTRIPAHPKTPSLLTSIPTCRTASASASKRALGNLSRTHHHQTIIVNRSANTGFVGLCRVYCGKTFKNVLMRFEADANSYTLAPRPDGTVDHVWRWTFLSGLQTGFPIYKRLTGNVQMLYSFDHKLKDSFPDRIVARIGVQWRFR